jgi:hypothetical protein
VKDFLDSKNQRRGIPRKLGKPLSPNTELLKEIERVHQGWEGERPKRLKIYSAGPVRLFIFCPKSIFLLASPLAGRETQCTEGPD